MPYQLQLDSPSEVNLFAQKNLDIQLQLTARTGKRLPKNLPIYLNINLPNVRYPRQITLDAQGAAQVTLSFTSKKAHRPELVIFAAAESRVDVTTAHAVIRVQGESPNVKLKGLRNLDEQ